MRVDDATFVEIMMNSFAYLGVDRHFFSKITGMMHSNPDGSSRVRSMHGCNTGDPLDLRHEQDNPVDSRAVAIHRADTGQQLGYLPAETAHELLERTVAEGGNWLAVLKEPYLDEEGQSIVGATIFVMHFPVKSAGEDA